MASLASLSIYTVPGRAGRAESVPTPRRRRMAVVRAKVREIFMPALSSTMTEGKIVSRTTAEGDRVSKGDPVVVVESDKADMDVETFHDGIIAAVLVPAGGTALVGAPIALLAESEEDVALAVAVAGGHWSFEAEVKSGEGDGDDRGPSPSLEERSWILSTGGRGSGVSLLSPAEELEGGQGRWILVDGAVVRSSRSSRGFPPRALGSWVSSPWKGRGSGRVTPRTIRSK